MLPLLMAGMAFAGTGIQSFAAKKAADDNARDLRWNAGMARVNAAEVKAAAEVEVGDLRRDTATLKSAQTVNYATQGVDVSQGAPVDLLYDTDKRMTEDIGRIRSRAAKQAWGLEQEAKQSERKAKAQKRQGRYALMGGLLGGAGSFGASVINNKVH